MKSSQQFFLLGLSIALIATIDILPTPITSSSGVAYLWDDLEQIKINNSPSLPVSPSPSHPEPSDNDATPSSLEASTTLNAEGAVEDVCAAKDTNVWVAIALELTSVRVKDVLLLILEKNTVYSP